METKDFGKVTVLDIRNDCNIRTRGFYDKKGDSWFFAKDLIKSLKYTEPVMKVLQKYCTDAVKGTITVDGHKKEYIVVSGGDIWELASSAPSKKAKGFQKFVFWHTKDYKKKRTKHSAG